MKKLTKSQVIAQVKRNNTLVIYLIPSKCQLSGYKTWVTPYPVLLTSDRDGHIYHVSHRQQDYRPFNDLVNEFMYYNCIPELGQRVHYYIKEEQN